MARVLVNLSIYLLSFVTFAAAAVKRGFIPFKYNGSVYQTWYIAHPPELDILPNRPLIALHGGPGLSHNYMVPIKDLSLTRTVIFYDQIGIGNSTHLDSQPDSFWSVGLFLEELENVIRFFGYDSFDLLGHSWGGMLAAEYAVLQPKGLNKLILSDSLAAMSLWDQSSAELLSTFPKSVQEGAAVGFSDPARYRAAMGVFFASYGCTVQPWPAALNASFDAMFADPTVAIKMGDVLANWTIVDRVQNIKVPTLVINGVHDIAQDFVIEAFLTNISGVTHVKFNHSSHTPMWEERGLYMSVVATFLA